MSKRAGSGESATRKVGVATSEWMCKRHGFQMAPAKGTDPKCKWCGEALKLNTWTMSGGA